MVDVDMDIPINGNQGLYDVSFLSNQRTKGKAHKTLFDHDKAVSQLSDVHCEGFDYSRYCFVGDEKGAG